MLEKIWYEEEAKTLGAALPIGNGTFGAIVYSGVKTEKISLTHDSFWSGFPREKDFNKNDAFHQARALMRDGDFEGAEKVIEGKITGNMTDTFLTGVNMFVDFPHSRCQNYTRELDLSKSILSTKYTVEDNEINYETFASYPDNLVAYKLTSKTAIDCSVHFQCYHPMESDFADNTVTMVAKAPNYVTPFYWQNKGKEMRYDDNENNRTILLSTVAHFDTDGKLEHKDGKTSVIGATYVIVYIKMDTSFIDFQTMPHQCMDKSIEKALAELSNLDYQTVKETHIKDYQKLYNTSQISLDEDKFAHMATDKRVIRQAEKHDDKSLVELLWTYGRYLLISSSRIGSQAANLQGLWNEQQYPAWSSGYTLNINIQMNYWIAETTNISECHVPFLEYIKGMAESGKKSAKEIYGCRGWCSHHKSDLWRSTMPVGVGSTYAFWPMSGGWLILHIWEHYIFTKDVEILKEYYPVIKECALFLMDWFSLDNDGTLRSYPSTSPENRHMLDGRETPLSFNSAMDIAIVNNVFNICLETEKAIGENNLSEEIKDMLPRLPKYQVGSDGDLLEWSKEYDAVKKLKHGHISPVYGLYPANDIKFSDKEMISACEAFLEKRNIPGGWGLGWRVAILARLKRGNEACEILTDYLRFKDRKGEIKSEKSGGLDINMYVGNPEFQIDASFGYTAGVTEMLIQSQEDKIDLLPALPTDWKDGSFKGLKARGNVTVDCVWKNNELFEATLYFANAGDYVVTFEDKEVKIRCDEAMKITVDKNLNY